MLTREEINKYIPLPVKMLPTAGIREIKLVASVILGCAISILCLAVPTTCLLPYAEYGLLHAHNYILPLGLIYVGVLAFMTASDVERANWINPETRDPLHMIRTGLTMKRLVWHMLFAICCIMEGSGELLGDTSQGVFHQVVKQIRSGKWGDLNPTETQQQALDIMYGIINISYVVARMAMVFGIILAAIIWINRASAADAQDKGEPTVTMSNGAGKDGEHVKIMTGKKGEIAVIMGKGAGTDGELMKMLAV